MGGAYGLMRPHQTTRKQRSAAYNLVFELAEESPTLLGNPGAARDRNSRRRRGIAAPLAAATVSLDTRKEDRRQGSSSGTREEASTSGRTSYELLPILQREVAGCGSKRYVWDGARIIAVSEGFLEASAAAAPPGARLAAGWARLRAGLRSAFFPDAHDVTPDYWAYARWRAVHRVFSSMSSVFATQSMLLAVGVGAQRSLPAAAAINWVLKDGLGRLGRLTVATSYSRSFDSDLKRFRFATSLLYCVCTGMEYLTPLAPQHFLLMASAANVGKSVGLTTFIATEPAFQKSFARAENMADVSAKTQAQQMVMDNLGLALAVGITQAAAAWLPPLQRSRLPLMLYPLLATGDLYAIYHELKAIHLRTLNKQRAEICVHAWLRDGRVPSPREVSEEETLLRPAPLSAGGLPLALLPLEEAVASPQQLQQLLDSYRDERYMLRVAGVDDAGKPPSVGWHQAWSLQRRVAVTLRDDAQPRDVLQAVLQAAYLRQQLNAQAPRAPFSTGTWWCDSKADSSSSGMSGGRAGGDGRELSDVVEDSHRFARANVDKLVKELQSGGWQVQPFMLSKRERIGYCLS